MNVTEALDSLSLSDENSTTGAHIQEDRTHYVDVFKWHGAEVLFLFTMFFFAILGNILVLYVYHFRWSRSNFSFYIKALALLDLTNASITIPTFIVITLDDEHAQFAQLCQGASFVAIMTAMASGVILVVIAYDRNRKICKPLETEMSMSVTRRLCGLALFTGLVLSVPSVFVYGRKEMPFADGNRKIMITQCYFTDEANGTPLFWIFMVALGLTFNAVMVTLAIFYVSMYRALKVHLARRESLSSRRPSVTSVKASKFRTHKTSAKIFFMVTVAFFSSYFPFFIAVTVFMIDKKEHVLSPAVKAVVDIAKLAPLLSNAINPIIYSATSRRFRMEVIDVFTCAAMHRTPSQRKRVKVHIKSNTSSTME